MFSEVQVSNDYLSTLGLSAILPEITTINLANRIAVKYPHSQGSRAAPVWKAYKILTMLHFFFNLSSL